MSKLNVDQKSIYELLSDRKADYIIPDYQRPYAWDEDNCQTLWDDIFSFAILITTLRNSTSTMNTSSALS